MTPCGIPGVTGQFYILIFSVATVLGRPMQDDEAGGQDEISRQMPT
jgi:hypothetical protein